MRFIGFFTTLLCVMALSIWALIVVNGRMGRSVDDLKHRVDAIPKD